MALFPFLIVLTSLAGFFGSKELADQAAQLLLQTWPKQVADALSGEIHDVLTTTRGDVLTIGAVLAVYFASNGVEALRVALNRAYAVAEPRRWYWLRLESIGYTLIAAFTSLAMAFLIVLGPLIIEAVRRHIPLIVETNENFLNVARYGITIAALIIALFILHAWLPAGPPQLPADPARHRLHLRGLDRVGHRVRPISGALRQQLRHDVCGAGVGHHRAGVSVFHRRDLRLWRRIERRDHQVAAAARRVASSSAVAKARGLTGLTRKASAPAGARRRFVIAAAGYPDDRDLAERRVRPRMRLIASMPSMPGSTMSISTASKSPCAIRSTAASPRPMNSA